MRRNNPFSRYSGFLLGQSTKINDVKDPVDMFGMANSEPASYFRAFLNQEDVAAMK